MCCEVYHVARLPFPGEVPPEFPGPDYIPVATVETDDLEEAFYLTNSVDHHWWQNPGVQPVVRSTSVGDVVVHHGRPYLCTHDGWQAI